MHDGQDDSSIRMGAGVRRRFERVQPAGRARRAGTTDIVAARKRRSSSRCRPGNAGRG